MFDYEKFRITLKEKRACLNLTLEQLSERAGIDYSTLSKIENGVQKPTVTTVISILNAINTNLSGFFENSNDEKTFLIESIIQIMKSCDERDKKLFFEIIKQ